MSTQTDYTGPFVYEDSKLAFIQTSEGRVVPDQDAYAYEYFLRVEAKRKSRNLGNHLGNTRVVFNEQGEVLQVEAKRKSRHFGDNSYYPFGGIMEGLNYTAGLAPENKYLFNGKELQDDFGLDWFDYGARMYNAQLGRWHVVDPMAKEYDSQSPYHFSGNNPLKFVDLNGMYYDGYQDMQGNYKWFDDETADVIGKEDNLWIKVTDDRNIFDMAVAGILDNVPEPTDPGQITEAHNLTSLEMWLDSPSESIGEGIGKIGANIGYSLVNSPYSLLTGKTIGGTSLNSSGKMDAFVDVAPALLSFGLTKTGMVIKTTEKGLQGYNKFLKGAKKSGMKFKGLNWQKNVSKAFNINKVNQQGLKDLDKARNVLNVVNTTKKELEK